MTKKVAWWTVGVFVAFFLITQPASAANSVKTAAHGLGHGFSSVITFFGTLF